jgi:thiamine-phosphate pyrophosphorylase
MVDLRLYALVDPERANRLALDELARRVAEGGATLVQLRDKHASTRRLVDEARAIKAALRISGVPLLINDRVDVALAVDADGVHIGQDDMAVEDAQRLLGPDAIVGLSINTVALAQAAPIELLDYVGIGGVYGTTSKAQKKAPIGTAGLADIVAAFHRRKPGFPTCGIAGINAGNAAEVIAAGADGIAVISALSITPDPAAAARNLRGIVDQALQKRGRG